MMTNRHYCRDVKQYNIIGNKTVHEQKNDGKHIKKFKKDGKSTEKHSWRMEKQKLNTPC